MTHGSATIEQNGNTLTINQATDRLIMGWHSFSIGQGETTRFIQPSSSSFALNRVYGGTRSMIEGRLEANGGVILINPAGITVTKSGVVNVNTFIGSTHDISDDEFLKGGALNFKSSSDASVENLGTIHAETGDIALIAHTVRNEGSLSAPKGMVGLAAGDEVLYQPNAEERLLVKSQVAAAAIHHSGSIQAAAVEIKAAGNPYAVAINLDGIVEARGNASRNSKPRVIVHASKGDINVGSTATISAADANNGGLVKIQAATGNLRGDGTVSVSSFTGQGGEIRILGSTITISGTTLLHASGATGGGKIFVGGDYQGGANPDKKYAGEPLQNASTLRIDKGAVMNADATVQGNGGVVINWADGTTVSSGSVSVRGGPLGGNGGFVEISGKQNLGFDGTVDLAAPKGTAGAVLFDPTWLQITSGTDTYKWGALLPTMSNATSYSGSYNMNVGNIAGITNGTITLMANYISLEDGSGYNRAAINLRPNVNLILIAKPDGTNPGCIYMPSAEDRYYSGRSSIAASGTGFVTLDASDNSSLVIHGDIATASGAITLIAQNDINLAGASVNSALGPVTVTSTAGNIFLSGSSIQSSDGPISVNSPAGAIKLLSYIPYGGVEANRIGSSISSGSGSVTLTSLNEIYLGGSTITTTGTNGGAISLTSTGSFIKLYADSIGTTSVMPAVIQTVGGNIALKGAQDGNNNAVVTAADYKFAVTLDGAILSSETGNIDITTTTGSLWLYYGSLSSATTIQTGSGNIHVTGSSSVYLYGALLKSTNGGSVSLISPTSYLQLYNAQIQTTTGEIVINSYYNALLYSSLQSETGKIKAFSSGYTYFADPNTTIKSSATGDAIVIISGMYFYNYAGTNALQATKGRWIVYNQNPANIYSPYGALNSMQDAIWNTPAGTPLASDKTGNRYVFESAPSAQLTLLSTDKIYGQSWTPLFGRDYTIQPVNGAGAFTMASSDLDFSGVTVSLSSLGYDAKATVGSYLVNFVSSTGGNISLVPGSSASLTVTPATLTLGVTNASKVYDGTTAIGLGSNNFVLSGLVNGDIVGLVNTPTSGTYATNGAGSGILVTAYAATNLALTGTLASNYVLNAASPISGYGSITPAMVTASLTGTVTKVYDATTQAATLTSANYLLSGIVGKDIVNLNNFVGGTYDSANVGTGKTVSVSGLALDNANYQLVSTTINGSIGSITPATLTASLTGSVSKVYDGDTAASLGATNYVLSGVLGTDKVGLNNPTSGSYDSANVGIGKTVSVGGLALTGAAAGNYLLANTKASAAIGQITLAGIMTEPTVQTAIQSLTIRNNTVTASSGGTFSSAGSGGVSTGSGGETVSFAETASTGGSSSSESGGATPLSESSGESGSSSVASTTATESGSAATTASAETSSSGSSSPASSPSGGSSSTSSSGSTSQGAKAQAAAMSRMNNPVAGATVGGAEFQRLNPFGGGEGMHEEVASAMASGGGNTQASTGRAAAVSVKSPEMTELAPMNDLNVLFMMF